MTAGKDPLPIHFTTLLSGLTSNHLLGIPFHDICRSAAADFLQELLAGRRLYINAIKARLGCPGTAGERSPRGCRVNVFKAIFGRCNLAAETHARGSGPLMLESGSTIRAAEGPHYRSLGLLPAGPPRGANVAGRRTPGVRVGRQGEGTEWREKQANLPPLHGGKPAGRPPNTAWLATLPRAWLRRTGLFGSPGGAWLILFFGGLFAAFDQFSNALAAFAANIFIKFLAVPLRRGLASAPTNIGVMLRTIFLFGGASTLAANLAVKVAAIPVFHRLTTFTTGFRNGHLGRLLDALFFWLCHLRFS